MISILGAPPGYKYLVSSVRVLNTSGGNAAIDVRFVDSNNAPPINARLLPFGMTLTNTRTMLDVLDEGQVIGLKPGQYLAAQCDVTGCEFSIMGRKEIYQQV